MRANDMKQRAAPIFRVWDEIQPKNGGSKLLQNLYYITSERLYLNTRLSYSIRSMQYVLNTTKNHTQNILDI
jgi:hypothetical protein